MDLDPDPPAPAETLRFDRVLLRRWRAGDADTVDRLVDEALPHLLPWTVWAAGHTREAALEYVTAAEREWAAREAFDYAITVGGTAIGSCALMRRIGAGGLEIGYWLHPAGTGQGLATMAAAALVRAAFGLPGVDRVEIHHDEANTASGAVPARLGFTRVDRRPVPEIPKAPRDVGIDLVWRLLRADADLRAPHPDLRAPHPDLRAPHPDRPHLDRPHPDRPSPAS